MTRTPLAGPARPAYLLLAFGVLVLPATTPAQEPAPLQVLVACQKGQLDHYAKYLETTYRAQCSWAGNDNDKDGPKDLKGLDGLKTCDVMLLNLYRTTPTPEQLAQVQAYFKSGRPVVGLRKASHAFQNWLEADQIVFGAKYGGHFFKNKQEQVVVIEDKHKANPLLAGLKPFMCGGGLYNYTQLASDVEVLMKGGPPGEWMPVTWTRVNKDNGQRVFYTRYDPNDLKNDEGCRRMVARALFWAAKRDLPASPP